METTTRVQMLMYGREAQSKTKTASPATIPKSGERNRKIHSCMVNIQILMGFLIFIVAEIVGVWFLNTHKIGRASCRERV